MPESKKDYTFEEVICDVAESYRLCVEKARTLFTEESAIQSASATMLINATKEISSVKALQNSLRRRIDSITHNSIPLAVEAWKWHFKDLVTELGPRITAYISHCVVNMAYSPSDMETHVNEYAEQLRHVTTKNNNQCNNTNEESE